MRRTPIGLCLALIVTVNLRAQPHTATHAGPPIVLLTPSLRIHITPARERLQSRNRPDADAKVTHWSSAGAVVQNSGREIVLAVGASRRVPETDLTVSFEAVVDDSRCPVGATCVWAGDVAVRIRVERPKAAPARYVLYLNRQSAREVEHGGASIRLLAVAPPRSADDKPRPAEYRVTLLIKRK